MLGRHATWRAFNDDTDEGVLRIIPLDGGTIWEANQALVSVHPHVPLKILDAIHLRPISR